MSGSLIPEKVSGKIVLCDHYGTNVRVLLLQLGDGGHVQERARGEARVGNARRAHRLSASLPSSDAISWSLRDARFAWVQAL